MARVHGQNRTTRVAQYVQHLSSSLANDDRSIIIIQQSLLPLVTEDRKDLL